MDVFQLCCVLYVLIQNVLADQNSLAKPSDDFNFHKRPYLDKNGNGAITNTKQTVEVDNSVKMKRDKKCKTRVYDNKMTDPAKVVQEKVLKEAFLAGLRMKRVGGRGRHFEETHQELSSIDSPDTDTDTDREYSVAIEDKFLKNNKNLKSASDNGGEIEVKIGGREYRINSNSAENKAKPDSNKTQNINSTNRDNVTVSNNDTAGNYSLSRRTEEVRDELLRKMPISRKLNDLTAIKSETVPVSNRTSNQSAAFINKMHKLFIEAMELKEKYKKKNSVDKTDVDSEFEKVNHSLPAVDLGGKDPYEAVLEESRKDELLPEPIENLLEKNKERHLQDHKKKTVITSDNVNSFQINEDDNLLDKDRVHYSSKTTNTK